MFKSLLVAMVLTIGFVGAANSTGVALIGYEIISTKATAEQPPTVVAIPLKQDFATMLACENAIATLRAEAPVYLPGGSVKSLFGDLRGWGRYACVDK